MAFATTGTLLLLVSGNSVPVEPATPGSKPPLGYSFLVFAVALVTVTPLIRPLLLALRWIRLGDYRFAAAGVGVVTIMVIAALAK